MTDGAANDGGKNTGYTRAIHIAAAKAARPNDSPTLRSAPVERSTHSLTVRRGTASAASSASVAGAASRNGKAWVSSPAPPFGAWAR